MNLSALPFQRAACGRGDDVAGSNADEDLVEAPRPAVDGAWSVITASGRASPSSPNQLIGRSSVSAFVFASSLRPRENEKEQTTTYNRVRSSGGTPDLASAPVRIRT